MTKTIDALVEALNGLEVAKGWLQVSDRNYAVGYLAKYIASAEAALAQARAEQAEPVGDCGNEECGWRGPLSECSYLGAVGPCCPHCREIVEPDTPPAAPVAKLEPHDWVLPSEAEIDEFVEDYEMYGESEDGRDACYQPTERERIVIKDAIMGLLAEHFKGEAAHNAKLGNK